ncbi:hypothetical protein GCM10010347_08650 [Streptomyces cirratus]|uniref:Uncharacterized protein n=1 Tax=Streptomyces cirratus TaxID=68187 RepID=A0ABQ3EIG2_9ACTN|nr:hypothetical protein GCM10010347_08650 [Streptomyces cirratus]
MTVFAPSSESAEEAEPPQAVREAARARLPVRAAAVRRGMRDLGMELPYGERESAGDGVGRGLGPGTGTGSGGAGAGIQR